MKSLRVYFYPQIFYLKTSFSEPLLMTLNKISFNSLLQPIQLSLRHSPEEKSASLSFSHQVRKSSQRKFPDRRLMKAGVIHLLC